LKNAKYDINGKQFTKINNYKKDIENGDQFQMLYFTEIFIKLHEKINVKILTSIDTRHVLQYTVNFLR
jgi:hypothetical protein